MRAPIGMSSPETPRGYPLPSQFSWWQRTIGTTGIRKVDEREDVGADVDVLLHLVELRRRQLARLVENVLGDGQLARVVEQRGRLDGFDRRLVGDAQPRGERRRHALHAPDVIVGHVVLRIDRHGERFDRGLVETIHFRDVLSGVLEPAE